MKVTLCVLCDRATVREGLLHILGAGIARLGRPVLPAPMGVDLGLMLVPGELGEVQGVHQVQVVIRDESSSEVALARVGMDFGEVSELPSPPPNIPLSIPLQNVGLSSYGIYTLSVEYDDHSVNDMLFVVEKEIAPGATAMLPADAESLRP
jgi:hypothetical protein